MIVCKIDIKKAAFECITGNDAVSNGAEAILLVKSIYKDVYATNPEMAARLKDLIVKGVSDLKGSLWTLSLRSVIIKSKLRSLDVVLV